MKNKDITLLSLMDKLALRNKKINCNYFNEIDIVYTIICDAYNFSIKCLKKMYQILNIDISKIDEYFNINDIQIDNVNPKTFISLKYSDDFFGEYIKRENEIQLSINKIMFMYKQILDDEKLDYNALVKSVSKTIIHEMLHKIRLHNLSERQHIKLYIEENGIDEIMTDLTAEMIIYKATRPNLSFREILEKIIVQEETDKNNDLCFAAKWLYKKYIDGKNDETELLNYMQWFIKPRNDENVNGGFIAKFGKETVDIFNKEYEKSKFVEIIKKI